MDKRIQQPLLAQADWARGDDSVDYNTVLWSWGSGSDMCLLGQEWSMSI